MFTEQNNNLNMLIYNTIKKRVYKFTEEEIDAVIKEEMKRQCFPETQSRTLYYYNTLSKILEYLCENGELHLVGGTLVPTDYMITTNYQINNMFLAYSYGLIRGNGHYMDDIERLYNVETGEEILKQTMAKKIILTGKLIGGGDYDQPSIPLYQISDLYQKFLMQGAPRDETINHILNYYQAISLDGQIMSEKYPNRYQISPKVKWKVKK